MPETESQPQPPAKPESKPAKPAKPTEVLVVVAIGYDYEAQFVEGKDKKLTCLHVLPGANIRSAALVEKLKNIPGFKARVDKGEIFIVDKWSDLKPAKRIEIAKRTVDSLTLPRITAEEDDPKNPEILEALEEQAFHTREAKA